MAGREDIVAIRTMLRGVQDVRSGLREVQNDVRKGAQEGTRSNAAVARSNEEVRRSFSAVSATARSYARETTADAGRAARGITSANSQIVRSMREVQQEARRTRSEMSGGSGSSMLNRLGGVTAGYFTARGAMSLLHASLSANQARRGAERQIDFNFGSGGAESVKGLQELADEIGLPLANLYQSFRMLAATMERDDILPTLRSIFAIGAKNGAIPNDIAEGLRQYAQTGMAGKLQGDELRILQERGINLIGLLKEAGMGERIRSQENPITFEELQQVVLDFGKTAEASEALALQSEESAANLARMSNVIQEDFLDPLGGNLKPAIQGTASALKFARPAIEFAGRNFFWIGGAMVAFWGYYKIVQFRYMNSMATASVALDRLAASAAAASVAEGGGVVPVGGGRAGRWGRVGNWFRRNFGSVAAGGGGAAVGAQAWRNVGGTGVARLWQPVAAGGGAAAGGAGMAAVGGIATAAAGAGVVLAIVSAIERVAGIKPEDTIFGQFANWQMTGKWQRGYDIQRDADQRAADFESWRAQRDRLLEGMGRAYGWGRRATAYEYAQVTGDFDSVYWEEGAKERARAKRMKEIEGSGAYQGRPGHASPRQSSLDRWALEVNHRSSILSGE